MIALQYCVGFYHLSTWISHRYMCVPSLLNLPSTFPSGNSKVSFVRRVFPMFPLSLCFVFFCLSFLDFEIVSSCCKFGSYFTGGLKRKIVVPFVSFGLGGSRQGRGTLIVVATLPQTWFHNEWLSLQVSEQVVCGLWCTFLWALSKYLKLECKSSHCKPGLIAQPSCSFIRVGWIVILIHHLNGCFMYFMKMSLVGFLEKLLHSVNGAGAGWMVLLRWMSCCLCPEIIQEHVLGTNVCQTPYPGELMICEVDRSLLSKSLQTREVRAKSTTAPLGMLVVERRPQSCSHVDSRYSLGITWSKGCISIRVAPD